MTPSAKPPVWKMVHEAVEALSGTTTNVAVRDWVLAKYPGTNTTTIACQIIVCTVNHDSRIHYPENQKPRRAESPYDFLYRSARGQLEWYDPTKHGQWEIAETDDGDLVVQQLGTSEAPVSAASATPPAPEGQCFAKEFHLRDFLASNLNVIEDGLQLYADEDGAANGVEYKIDMGRIDILAEDRDGGLLIIELKVDRGPDEVCGQIMRYVGWVKRHLANGRRVRGLIIARHISDRIRYAIADVPDVTAREYVMQITLAPVVPVENLR